MPPGGRTFEKVRSKLLIRRAAPSGKVFGPTFFQKGGPPEANRQVRFDQHKNKYYLFKLLFGANLIRYRIAASPEKNNPTYVVDGEIV
jgi:hypothetical protein